MVVYRISKKEEIYNIFHDENCSNIGKVCNIDRKINTHLYEAAKRYIHFFKEFDSLFYLNTSAHHFICIYDIPKYVLEKRAGVGYYLDRVHFQILEGVTEYALENDKVHFLNLQEVKEIMEYIDFEDYINGDISFKTKRIYQKDKESQIENLDKLYDILMEDDIISSINQNIHFIMSLIPELKLEMGFEHMHPHHHLDVWNHTLYALSFSPPNFDVRLALLLHDIGKTSSYIEKDGIRHFHGHAKEGANRSYTILKRLGFDKDYRDKICYLIRYHDTPITEEDVKKDYELSYTRYLIQECDAMAHNPDKLEKRKEYLKDTKKIILNKSGFKK